MSAEYRQAGGSPRAYRKVGEGFPSLYRVTVIRRGAECDGLAGTWPVHIALFDLWPSVVASPDFLVIVVAGIIIIVIIERSL